MPQLTIVLEQEERVALYLLAKAERRDPREQAALLIRHLERLGLLQPPSQIHSSKPGDPPDENSREGNNDRLGHP